MTRLLEEAVETARELPSELQDEIASLILAFAGRDQLVELSAEDEAAVLNSREAARRGEFASDADLRAIRAKYVP